MSGYILTKLPSIMSSIVLGHNLTKPFMKLNLNIHVEIISFSLSYTFDTIPVCGGASVGASVGPTGVSAKDPNDFNILCV